ncbi:MAG: hypothetical protein IJY28_10770 [Clostridia bacterium]|nr:hypothetical protein [Clostridia bacterium]
MIEQDTIKLLRECDAGIKMGIASIDDVMISAGSRELRECLTECRRRHEKLEEEIEVALQRFHDDGKDPSPMAKGMSWVKTNVKLALDESDQTIADLMVDGCDMGVKSLNKYLNQYKAADEQAKDIAKKLIAMEEQLGRDMRRFL